jgi:RNA polymerase primary sigma factor
MKEKVVSSKKQDSSISSYFSSLKRFDNLTHDESISLFRDYAKGRKVIDKDQDCFELTNQSKLIRNRLIEANLKLVISIAKQYKGYSLPLEDLIQEGNLGLIKSIDRYDPEKGFRFSTYATWWIKQAIGQHILKRKRMIRLPAHAASVHRKLSDAVEDFKREMGCEPSQEELSAILGTSEDVLKATVQSSKSIVSLQQLSFSSPDSDAVEDRIEDKSEGIDPFQNVSDKQVVTIIRDVLFSLSPKEATILRLRFGLAEENDDDVNFPISQSEINKIELTQRGLQDNEHG